MVETVDIRIALDEGDYSLPTAWEKALDAEAAPRNVSRALLVRLIIHDWLQQHQPLLRPHRHRAHVRRSEADYLQMRLLARITDQRRMSQAVTITDLAHRLGMTHEITQAMVSELVRAGMLTGTLNLTEAGVSILEDYSRDTP